MVLAIFELLVNSVIAYERFILVPKEVRSFLNKNNIEVFEFLTLLKKYKKIIESKNSSKVFFLTGSKIFVDNKNKLKNKKQITYDNFLFFLRKISKNNNLIFNEYLMEKMLKKITFKKVFKHLLKDYQKNYKNK
jgi:hypothetical protein